LETTLSRGQVNEYIYFNGQRACPERSRRVTQREHGVGWFNYAADHLGSARIVTDAAGNVLEESDYYPGVYPERSRRGEEKVYTSTCPQNYKFTGKERDAESGLDNFGARYYGSTLGRFLQVDPANVGALLPEPQTWNAYAYVGNNPLRFIDPLGLQKSDGTLLQTAQDSCEGMLHESGACTHTTEARTGQNSGGCETASNDPCGDPAPGHTLGRGPGPDGDDDDQGIIESACSAVPDAVTGGAGGDFGLGFALGGQLGTAANGQSGELSVFVTGTFSFGLIGPDAYAFAGVVPNAPENAALNGQGSPGIALGYSRNGVNISKNNYQVTYGPSLIPYTAAIQDSSTAALTSIPYLGYLFNFPRAICKAATGN
jgi:RHS repeat-associated protein